MTEADLIAEATQSRGPADDRPYVTSSRFDGEYVPALTNVHYQASDAELARMPAPMRSVLLARRVIDAERRAADDLRAAQILAGRVADVRNLNRERALQRVSDEGITRYFTQCACGWCGLYAKDPEVARREYDDHACAADGVSQRAVDRAIVEVDRKVLAKRDAEEMLIKPSMHEPESPLAGYVPSAPEVLDDAGQRFALLELK
jgi:hypothetical protein